MNRKDELETLFCQLVGQTMRRHREELHLTQTAAARNFDNFRQWISKVENGETSLALYSFFKYTTSNGIDFLKVLQEAAEAFIVQSQPLRKIADQKKLDDYIKKTKKK